MNFVFIMLNIGKASIYESHLIELLPNTPLRGPKGSGTVPADASVDFTIYFMLLNMLIKLACWKFFLFFHPERLHKA